MDKHEVKLSVIIPTYNSEKTIERALHSVVWATENVATEIILVDDGSTDSTLEVVKKYFNDKNVKMVMNLHAGVSHARNTGIKEAQGKYVMFVDSDDCLVAQIPAHILESSYSIVNFSAATIESRSNSVISSKKDKLGLIYSAFGFAHGNFGKDEYIGGPYSKLYKTDGLVQNNIFFNEQISNSEDLLFNVECINYAQNILLYRLSLYLIVPNYESVTHSIDLSIFKNHMILLPLLNKQILNYYPDDKSLIKLIDLLYLYQLIFRYFVYSNGKAQYKEYLQLVGLRKQDFAKYRLSRFVERITIIFLYLFGFKFTVQFAKIYLWLKKNLKKTNK